MDGTKLQCRVISQSGPICKGCILFLHGLGNTSDGLIKLLKKAWGENISFPHIKMVFPTAPVRSYTRLGGQMTTAWYDRHDLSLEGKEDASVDKMCHVLNGLIQQEVDNGIPKERIMIGKFSVLKKTEDKENLPHLFQCHGKQDDIIDIELAKDTFNILTSLGVKGTFHTFDMGHEIIQPEVRPYTLLDGQRCTVWFDQHTMCPKEKEIESTDEICSTLSDIINEEEATLWTLREVLNKEHLPPVFLYHGERDDIVPIEWAKDTYKTLTDLGIQGELHIDNIEHELTKEEIKIWRDWVILVMV
ncbi:hypothetical protein KUTeg_013349 [Tegillarca granosa]|uniref:palmitoyl-protein hydrolase n=1 Tax=Tegillarca granosa TaxID=220873 RepID=A0ABQ9EYK9_TEGGR|nr:hypothetical protein KUTeg_013349 [Tegillarca granosa]